MANSLIFKNTGASVLTVDDLGIYLGIGEDLDIIVNFRDEDIIESVNIEAALSGNGEVWLNNTTQLTYTELIEYLTKLSRYDKIDYTYISGKDDNTDVTGAELEILTDGSDTSLHNHDSLYYTKTQLQTSGDANVDWGNIINAPQFGDLHWANPVDRTNSGYGSGSTLPTAGNTLNDARMVKDDGDGKPAQYVCVATTGTWNQQWIKIADVDWGSAANIGVTPVGNLSADDVQEALEELQGDIDNIVSLVDTIDMDYTYDRGSTVTVDNTDVVWDLSTDKKFQINGGSNIISVEANASGDKVSITGILNTSGPFHFNGTSSSSIDVANSSLSISTTTSGNITITSAGELSFKDQYLTSSITLSESGEDSLDSEFTAVSIVGAINELKRDGGSVNTLDDAYDGESGSGSGREITVDNGPVKLNPTASYAPLEMVPQATAPSAGLVAGQMTVIDGDLYLYNGTKWLSVSERVYTFAENVVDGKYMRVGEAFGNTVGYTIPVNATITRIVVKENSGNPIKALQIRKNSSPVAIKSFSLTNSEYSSTEDIDLSAGDTLQVFVSGAGASIKNAIVDVYIKWKK